MCRRAASAAAHTALFTVPARCPSQSPPRRAASRAPSTPPKVGRRRRHAQWWGRRRAAAMPCRAAAISLGKRAVFVSVGVCVCVCDLDVVLGFRAQRGASRARCIYRHHISVDTVCAWARNTRPHARGTYDPRRGVLIIIPRSPYSSSLTGCRIEVSLLYPSHQPWPLQGVHTASTPPSSSLRLP